MTGFLMTWLIWFLCSQFWCGSLCKPTTVFGCDLTRSRFYDSVYNSFLKPVEGFCITKIRGWLFCKIYFFIHTFVRRLCFYILWACAQSTIQLYITIESQILWLPSDQIKGILEMNCDKWGDLLTCLRPGGTRRSFSAAVVSEYLWILGVSSIEIKPFRERIIKILINGVERITCQIQSQSDVIFSLLNALCFALSEQTRHSMEHCQKDSPRWVERSCWETFRVETSYIFGYQQCKELFGAEWVVCLLVFFFVFFLLLLLLFLFCCFVVVVVVVVLLLLFFFCFFLFLFFVLFCFVVFLLLLFFVLFVVLCVCFVCLFLCFVKFFQFGRRFNMTAILLNRPQNQYKEREKRLKYSRLYFKNLLLSSEKGLLSKQGYYTIY